MKVSVIISTYNAEEWLQKVLTGYSVQTETDFEIIIADDGSTSKTKEVIDLFRTKFNHPIQHIWHEDIGFRKCKILNAAIVSSKSDYLIFTDGDCIPRNDFIKQHLHYKEQGYFLSGGYFKLPMSISKAITADNIENQDCFKISWLKEMGLKMNFKVSKLTNFIPFALFMNWLTPTKRSWNGHNSSGYKNDIITINGFNELMDYGGEDREMGERLFNLGLLSKQIRYSAICIHLDHERSYSKPENWKKNNEIRYYNKVHKVIVTPNGINKTEHQ